MTARDRSGPSCHTPARDHQVAVYIALTPAEHYLSRDWKPFLQEHGEVCISPLGIAVSPAVTVAEILKQRDLATEKQIETSLESVGDLPRSRQKPKIDIVLVKTSEFDDIIAAESQPLSSTDDHTASADTAPEITEPSTVTADGQIGPVHLLDGPSEGG
ncbi:hypothetical protein WJX77_006052 [Trebouxia sp. C0004]